jgi:transcriptional regulator with XRE-family HTH domain
MQRTSVAGQGSISGTTLRLRADVFDALAAERGARTLRQQAALTGVSRSTLSRIRRGEGLPSLDVAMQLAEKFGVPISVLFERTGTGQ